MRHLTFDLSQDLAFETQSLRNLDEERFRFGPAVTLMALEAIRRRPVRSERFGRRSAADPTLH